MRGATVLGAVLGLLLCASAHANDVPAGARWSTAQVRAHDGVALHADVFTPATASAPVPAILIVSPYFGLQGSGATAPAIPAKYADLYARAFPRGYAVVQVTMRGFGASGGCRDFGGPATQRDAVTAVRWVARQPWSDGHVAMWGLSTDGWAALMALAGGAPELDALVLNAPVLGAYQVAFHEGVAQQPFTTLTDAYYAAHAAPPLTVNDPAQVGAGVRRLLGDAVCAPDAVATGRSADPAARFWRERELLSRLRGSTTPVLWSHGFLDSNARPDNILPLWSSLRGPRRAWLGQFPHVTPGQAEMGRPEAVGRAGFAEEALRFLDHALRGAPAPADPPVAVQEGTTGLWRAERRWPPTDVRRLDLPLWSGSYRDGPGNKGELLCLPQLDGPAAALDPSCLPGPVGRGAWTLTPALRAQAWLAGAPALEATLAARAGAVHLHAFLYGVDRDGDATLISRGATLAGSGTVRTALYPQDWRIAAGHRIGVLLSGADDLWFAPGTSLTRVRVRGGRLRLPVLVRERRFDLAGTPSASQRARTRFRMPRRLVSRP